jgi:NAD(P)H-quinone oxidoreductase subunit 5
LVAAGNLYLLVGAWVAMSLLLNRLLLFRRERRMARIAATKKFILARIGDVSLIVACGLLIAEFGTAEIEALGIAIAALPGELPGAALAAAALLALTAVLKSAQFPTHGWLVEVMETPPPVSALLHAGIVNAGGFLFLRFADLMTAAPTVGLTVAGIGAVTALVGTTIMLTQPSIKAALAYSTVGQMGFMMLQCGLGAYTAATVHLVGHSLYKAHAFLSSGDVVRRLQKEAWTAGAQSGGLFPGLAKLVALGAIYVGLATTAGFGWQSQPVILSLGWMLVLGLWLFMDAPAQSIARQLRLLVGVVFVAGAYFAVQSLAAVILGDALSVIREPGLAGRGLLILMVAACTAIALLQASGIESRRLQNLRIHLSRGLYINLYINRWLGAFRAESTRQGA